MIVLWIGQHASNTIINELFGVASHSQIDTHLVSYIS